MKAGDPVKQSGRSTVFDGRYQIHSTIGHGQNSIIYETIRLNDDGPSSYPYALKVFTGRSKNPEENIERMKREAQALLAARSEHIIHLYDYVQSSNLCYLVLEYANCGDLWRELTSREEPFSQEEVVKILLQVLTGLAAVHRAGIIHRDLKPENMLINSAGQVKLTDFGIALLPTEEPTLEETSRGVGTLEYLAPEYLADGKTSFATDIYSLGITAYVLLTKQLPFSGESLTEQIKNKMNGRRMPLAALIDNIDPHLQPILDRALAPLPEHRYQTALEFHDALLSLSQAEPEFVGEPEALEPFEDEFDFTFPAEEVSEDSYTEDPFLSSSQLFKDKVPLRPKQAAQAEEQFLSASSVHPHSSEMDFELGSLDQPPPTIRYKRMVSSRTIMLVAAMFCVAGVLSLVRSNLETIAVRRLAAKDSPPQSVILRAGVLYDLRSSGDMVPLTINTFADSSQAMVTVGLPGWNSPTVDAATWESGEQVVISANGFKFALWQEKEDPVAGNKHVRGRYRDLSSGREGPWVLW